MFFSPTEAFSAYLNMAQRLPAIVPVPSSQTIQQITDLVDDIDVFLFDAYGVLNVGGTAIAGAAAQIAKLRAAGKLVYVVTNAATQSKPQLLQKFIRLGFDFSDQEIINSREVLLQHMPQPADSPLGIITLSEFRLDLARPCYYPEDEAFWQADEFLFLSGQAWNAQRQARFIEALNDRPRPVWVGNSDLIAPLENGVSQEPGSYTLTLPAHLFEQVRCFGKPFAPIFDTVLAKIKPRLANINRQRIAMIGDTLHTDILGGNAMGFKSVLVTQHGFLRDLDVDAHIQRSNIRPHFQLKSI
ncbi:HAD-IIA family hydrolase [Agarivorans sp. QJM3NY_25]|uniref:HAD-IIA family hydrolase n=1 Tax=Agarivorans sp. QJM3NY_25 TaxID=3421430 RepID=UPI003D7CFE69